MLVTSSPSIISISTAYDAGFGNDLGVCCDPSWDKAPITLSHNGTNWSGQVPVGKDWKFVILQNGHISKWENGQNRHCDGKESSFSLNPNELNFS